MYTKESIEVFLKGQSRLYDEPVAETPEEAEEFLEEHTLTGEASKAE